MGLIDSLPLTPPIHLYRLQSPGISSTIKVMKNLRKIEPPYVFLWLFFFVFVAIRITLSMPYWTVLTAEACGLSIVLLLKAGKPSKKYVLISVIFAVLSTVAYLGYQQNPWILLYGLRAGVPTLLCSLAVFSVMEKRHAYALISDKGRSPVLISLLIAVAVGAVLSVVNFFLSGESAAFDFSLWKLLLCLNPAIYEEMACRAIFMAFCIWYSEDTMDVFRTFTMYFMMCVPHAVVHGFPLVETMILTLLFGLPFTIMQKKRDIAGAMISHGIVDAVRFTLTGI